MQKISVFPVRMIPANPQFSWVPLRFHRMFPGFIVTEKNRYFGVPIASLPKKPVLFELAWASCPMGMPRQKGMKKSIENFRLKESQQISKQIFPAEFPGDFLEKLLSKVIPP